MSCSRAIFSPCVKREKKIFDFCRTRVYARVPARSSLKPSLGTMPKEGFNDNRFSETSAADPALPMPSRFKRSSLPREYKVATEAVEPVESSVLLSVRAKPTGMNLTGETQVLRSVAGVNLVGRYATGQNKNSQDDEKQSRPAQIQTMNLRGHHAPPWKGLREVRPSTVSSTHRDSGPRVMLPPNTMTGKELTAVVKEEQAIHDSVCNVTGISLSRDMVDRHVESHSQTLSPESKIPSPTKRRLQRVSVGLSRQKGGEACRLRI